MRRTRGLTLMDPLVLAFRAGAKDVTRRMSDPGWKPGDVVPVLEALVPLEEPSPWHDDAVSYRCDGEIAMVPGVDDVAVAVRWPRKVRVLPARYCPTRFVRSWAEVVDVRPEPLTAITHTDVTREGVTAAFGWVGPAEFVDGFRGLHQLQHDADPVVHRIEFRPTEAP